MKKIFNKYLTENTFFIGFLTVSVFVRLFGTNSTDQHYLLHKQDSPGRKPNDVWTRKYAIMSKYKVDIWGKERRHGFLLSFLSTCWNFSMYEWQGFLWDLCTNMPNSANCKPIIRPTHAVHVRQQCDCKSMDCAAAGDGQGGASRSQISTKTISIDLVKSVETNASRSWLWQSAAPPLGSDLHYDDE